MRNTLTVNILKQILNLKKFYKNISFYFIRKMKREHNRISLFVRPAWRN